MEKDLKKFMYRIRDIRENAKLSGEKFGKLFDVSKTTVSQWESGDNWPKTETMIKICDLFNVSLDFLAGRTDFKHSVPGSGGNYIVDAEEALGILTSNYNDIQKATLENMVKMFDLENKDVKKNIGAVQNSSVSAKVKK